MKHGGDLFQASERFRIQIDNWIDLSTGINPMSYPLDQLKPESFQRLPYLSPEFTSAVTSYYSSDQFVPVAGSQRAIQLMPECLADLPVILPSVGYQEHYQAWAQHDVSISYYDALDINTATIQINALISQDPSRHLVIINPNNPSSLMFTHDLLNDWSARLASNACLIVDEAFIDVLPENSMLNGSLADNVIVLRSFGKFFGLAGLRVGFVFGNESIRAAFHNREGLWTINGPAQDLVIQACNDLAWQQAARNSIVESSLVTRNIFEPLLVALGYDERAVNNSDQEKENLFSSYVINIGQAHWVYQYFANAGILLRILDAPGNKMILRVGCLNITNYVDVERTNQCVSQAIAVLSSQPNLKM
jgi:cobalamin biosynthetic protein CobC